MKRRQTLVAIAAVVVVLSALVGWSAFRHTAVASPRAERSVAATPNVRLATARVGTFVQRVDAQGKIGPPAGSSSKIAFALPGILATIDVHVGDTVHAGQPVAALDRSSLAAAVAQARADAGAASASYGGGAVPASNASSAAAKVAVARERLATLERGGPSALSSRITAESAARQAALKVAGDRATIARDRALLAGGVLAAKDVDAARALLASDLADQRAADAKVAVAGTDFAASVRQARADVAAAQNDLQTARAQAGVLSGQAASAGARLETAQIAYANGVLTAPSDGVVLSIAKHAGESVDATQPVMEIGPAAGHGVTLNVPSEVARRISVGDPATLKIEQNVERVTHGRVMTVVPVVDPATQLATVVVSGAPGDAVAGDAVTATIVVGHAPGILVPTSAIVQDPQTGKTVVFVRDEHPKAGESGFSLREVTIRASDTTTAAIASGLRAGEHIAAQGGYALLAPAGA
ncbi:MAG: hypothetical protein NVSMB19_21060 [Vulcanimicrobiaceae bacterium]